MTPAGGMDPEDACVDLPVDGRTPDVFEALGFQFPPGGNTDPLFCRAILPKGWKKVPQRDSTYWSNILDERGVVRVVVFTKNTPWDRDDHMRLADTALYVCVGAVHNGESIPWPVLTPEERQGVVDHLTRMSQEAQARSLRHPPVDAFGVQVHRQFKRIQEQLEAIAAAKAKEAP